MKKSILFLLLMTVCIIVNAQLTVTATTDRSICLGDSASLNAIASGGTAPYTYTWSPATALSCTNCPNPKASPTTSVEYTVTALDSLGNSTATKIRVNLFKINIRNNRDSLCAGDTTIIHVSSNPPICGLNAGGCSGLTIGHEVGTSTASSPYPSPYFGLREDARLQIIYRKSELNAMGITGGTITQIAFNVERKYSSQPYSNFTIKMGNTALTMLNTGWQSGLSTVYSGNHNTSLGWNTHNLTTPYDWDGESNLLVEICFDNAKTTSYDYIYYSNNGYISSVFYYLNGSSGCNLTSTYLYSRRPNTRFTMCYQTPTAGSVAWSPGGSLSNPAIDGPEATVSTTTTYTALVSDGLGCSISDSVTIFTRPLSITTSPTASICIGDSTQLSVTSNMGSTSYSWSPSTGLSCTTCSNPIALPTVTTSYYITSTSGACTSLDTITVIINPLPPADAGTDTSLCVLDSVPLNGSGGVGYSWLPQTGIDDPMIANPNASPSSTIIYTVTVTSDSGCIATDDVTVTVSGLSGIQANSERDTLCAGDTTQLDIEAIPTDCGLNYAGCAGLGTMTPIGAGTNYTAWPGPYNGSYEDARLQILFTKEELNAAGIFGGTIKEIAFNVGRSYSSQPYTDFTMKMGCTSKTNLSGGVWINGLTEVYYKPNYTVSVGWNRHFLDTHFNWDGNSNIIIETCYDNTSKTTYDGTFYTNVGYISTLFRYSDGIVGCNFPSPYSYSSRPDVRFTMCNESLTTATFGWTPTSGLTNSTIANPVATVTTNITYTISVDDGSGCANTDTISLNTAPLDITILTGDTTICEGDGFQVKTRSNIEGAAFSWTPALGLSCTNCDNPQATPTTTTTYYATATSSACTDYDTITVTVNPKPIAIGSDDTMLCQGDTIQMNVTGGVTYNWSPTTGLSNPFISNPLAYPSVTTLYIINVTSAVNCSSSDSIWVTVNDTPVLAPTSDRSTICAVDTTRLRANNSTPGQYFYTWTPASGLSDSTSANPIATVSAQTTYTVFVDGTGSCVNTDSVTVSIAPLSITTKNDTTLCENDTYVLSTSSNISGTTYAWSPTTGLSCVLCPSPIASINSTTTYTVTATSGTCTDIGTVKITVNPLPIVNAGTDATVCKGETAQLNGSGTTSYTWVPISGLSNPNIANPTATPTATTVYTIVGTSPQGCSNSDAATVFVKINELTISTEDDTICFGDSATLYSVTCNTIIDHFNNGIDYSKWSTTLGGYTGVGCGSVTGDALYYDGPGVRQAVTKGINFNSGESINFYLKYGTGLLSCEKVDSGKEVIFEYSINNGGKWDAINTYEIDKFTNFSKVNEIIPKRARTLNTLFRWRQKTHDGPGKDNWAIDDINICSRDTSVLTYQWTPAGSLSDPSIYNPIVKNTMNTTYVVTATDGTCSNSDTLLLYFVECITNVSMDPKGREVIEVYPNPTTDVVYVYVGNNNEKISSIRILDPIGNEININSEKIQADNPMFSFNLEHLSSGLYFIEIISENKTIVKKFMLQK